MRALLVPLALVIASLVAASGFLSKNSVSPANANIETTQLALEELGEMLFFDVNLSANRSQSCSSCHDPNFGFADPRDVASLGDDGVSLGDRNAPTASYAAFIPTFHRNEDGEWVGGQFWDGRAATLEDQAAGPPLNPGEMGMPSTAAILERLVENDTYRRAFPALFGERVLEDPDAAYTAMTEAIAAFERTDFFAPFDSKYDRFLRGEVALTDQEELGRILFFSEQFTNCNQCHQTSRSAIDPQETFSDYLFHNIGTPQNWTLRDRNGVQQGTIDGGLALNPDVDAAEETVGRFRTPTLRNVAVTGPYMHNGVFADLRTVVLFYNTYNTRSDERLINPETGLAFDPPPVPQTLSLDKLEHGPALDDKRIDALVAFLRTLTDARYEHLLDTHE
ncbi:MAG: cytochrome c peroxidase [Pseudomonadota bacterium]